MGRNTSLNHKIWDIAWPAILSNISIPLLGLVDTAILGHLSDTRYLGGVAIGAAILSFLYWGFSFLRMGTTGLVATTSGAGNHRDAQLVLARSAILALGIAALVMISRPLWLPLGMHLMAPSLEIQPWATSYISIRVWSAPAVLITYTLVGWFIGRQNTRWPMVFVLVTNITNIALDFLFIVGLDMRSDGAAWATVIAETLGCFVAIAALRWGSTERAEPNLWQELFQWDAYARLLKANRDLFIRTTCLLFGFAFFTAASEKFGGEVLAANTMMLQLLMMAAYGMDGFAYAAEALAGNRVGARDHEGFAEAVAGCTRWCAVSALLMSIVFALLQAPIFALLTNLPSVTALLETYIGWLVLLPLVAAPSYLLDGVFIGAARTAPMMVTMVFSLLGVYLPCWHLTQDMGNHGLWLSFTLFNLSRGVTLALWYRHLNRHAGWFVVR